MSKLDTKEFELPETIYIRDIETPVFQSIILNCLSKIEGISLLEGNFIDSLLGRDGDALLKGIYVEQDQRNHSVNVKVEVNVAYGVQIPEKAEEIQTELTMKITELTGLHVGVVHVVFKNLIFKEMDSTLIDQSLPSMIQKAAAAESDYLDEF